MAGGWAALAAPQDERAGWQALAEYAGALPEDGKQRPDVWQRLGETGWAKLAKDAWAALKAPGDAYAGRMQVMDPATGHASDEAIKRSTDLAGMLTLGAGAMPAEGTVNMGVKRPDSLFDYSRLHEVPNVPQVDLPRYTPPRGVPARVADVTSDPAVREKMLGVIQAGRDMGGANWYNAEPLREAFIKELGQDAGNASFRHYMDLVAATSPRSDVGTNVRNASYYYGRLMRGEGMPEVGTANPQPYGHMAQRLHQMNAQRVAGPGWDPLNNPKPASFVENLVGNQQPATIDTHAFRLPGILAQDPRFLETAYQSAKDAPKQNIQKMVASGEVSMADAAGKPAWWQAQPKENEYAAMERYYQGLGQELGLTPAQTQASAWVGGGKLTGLASDESKPFLQFFEDRLRLTAEKSGMDPRDVLKRFIRGDMPLLGVGGAAAAGLMPYAQDMLSQLEPQQQAPQF